MTDEDKQKEAQLNSEIVIYKNMLKDLYADNKPLNQGQILSISRLLDEKINQYMKLQKQIDTEEKA